MKSGKSFEQCYNAQAAVDTATMLIVGQHVTDQANDKQQLVRTLAVVSPALGEVDKVFGIIKEVHGFRSFLLRGREKVSLEWELVSTSYHLKRLYNLGMRLKGSERAGQCAPSPHIGVFTRPCDERDGILKPVIQSTGRRTNSVRSINQTTV